MVVPSRSELVELINSYQRSIRKRIEEKTKAAKDQLSYLLSRPVYAKKDTFYKMKMQEVEDYSRALQMAYKQQLTKGERRYELAIHKLEQLSPLNTLKRGYSLTMKEDKIIKQIADVELGELLSVRVTDGNIAVQVCEKESLNGQKSG